MIASGWLIEHFSWGAVFLINAPVAVVALDAAYVLVPESKDHASRRIDLVSGALSMATVTALIYTLIEAPRTGWLDPVTLAGSPRQRPARPADSCFESTLAHSRAIVGVG